MMAVRLYANDALLRITGEGYSPKGELLDDGKPAKSRPVDPGRRARDGIGNAAEHPIQKRQGPLRRPGGRGRA